MNQLLLRIDERLRLEQDSNLRAELVAQQASYLARIGQFDSARQKIADLRSVFSDGRSGRVTALIMLAEGLLLHYELLAPGALDRVKRAQLLGQGMKDREIAGLASAWRAHLEFEQSCYDDAVRSLRLAFESVSENHHAAHARCAIVLFNGFALCGNHRESQRWFMSGRDHALRLGDQAGIDALLHSRAAFGLAWLRAQRCSGPVSASALATVRVDISSARNLQRLAQVEAHAAYIDLCTARLRILEDNFEGAIQLLMLVRNAGPFPTGHLSQSLVDLEIVFCNAMLGRIELAVQAFALLQDCDHGALDVDDRLVASWMAFELTRLDRRFGSTDLSQQRFNQASVDYEAHLHSLRGQLAEFAEK